MIPANWAQKNSNLPLSRLQSSVRTPLTLNPTLSWETTYTNDLTNHAYNPADIGTIWFSDALAEEKISDYLFSEELGLDAEKTSFLDVGTGNGSLLFRLREGGDESDGQDDDDVENVRRRAGFKGTMVGVDYAPASVRLARRVAVERGMGPAGEKGEVRFEEWDIMKEEPGEWMSADGVTGERGFDVVLDKGTFDAVSLGEERDERGRRICEGYRDRVQGLVRRGGLLLITSCNWTEGELRSWFEGEGEGELVFWGRVRYPSFTFGGRTGQSISSVCFKRRS